VKRAKGTTQHDAAPKAAKIPPIEASPALRVEESAWPALSAAAVNVRCIAPSIAKSFSTTTGDSVGSVAGTGSSPKFRAKDTVP
jgi:hypothetical protein